MKPPARLDKLPQIMAVIHSVSDGKTVAEACRDNGVRPREFEDALEDPSLPDEVRSEMERAQRRCYTRLSERLIDAAQFNPDPKVESILSSNIKWVLEKLDKRFAKTVTHDVTDKAREAVMAAIARAQNRVTVIDAQYDVVERKGGTAGEGAALVSGSGGEREDRPALPAENDALLRAAGLL